MKKKKHAKYFQNKFSKNGKFLILFQPKSHRSYYHKEEGKVRQEIVCGSTF